VTTSHYTKSAREAAERLNIKLINGAYVHDMVRSLRKKKVGSSLICVKKDKKR